MLRAHSILWHYFWVAPNLLLLLLAFLLWRRRLHRTLPFFFAFALVCATGQLIVYAADITPSIDGPTWWRIFWTALLAEGALKFALIADIFYGIFGAYPSLARVGKFSIRGVGVVFVLLAALAAAFSSQEGILGIIAGAHLMEQTIYLIECGLLVFIFLFSAYFRLSISRRAFGIALGLGISACVQLATWGVIANEYLADKRDLLDFVNMATYHACVLIWFYYLLVPQKIVDKPVAPPPDNNLGAWNRELERLLQR
jgi:hypothetical protein